MKLKKIAKIIDGHGLKGELKVKFLSSEIEWLDSLEFVVINEVQYDVISLRQNKTFWILKLKNLDDRNESEKLKGQDVLADESLFLTQDGEDPYLSELMGFSVEVDGRTAGDVVGFKETSAHFLLVLKTYKGYFEIPYVDDFIVEVLRSEKKIVMKFPEDLLSDEFKLKESFDDKKK